MDLHSKIHNDDGLKLKANNLADSRLADSFPVVSSPPVPAIPTSTNSIHYTTTPTPAPEPSTTLSSSISPVPTFTSSQNDGNQQPKVSSNRSSSSAALIAGITCGALGIVACILFFWWYLRWRRRQLILSHSKTILTSSQGTLQTSKFAGDLERQETSSHLEHGDIKGSYCSYSKADDYTLPPLQRPAGDVLTKTVSSTVSLPIQLPTYLLLAPREKSPYGVAPSLMMDDIPLSNTSSRIDHRTLRQNTSLPINLPSKPAPTHASSSLSPPYLGARATRSPDSGRYASAPSLPEIEAQHTAYYIDMLDFEVENELRKSLANLRSLSSSPSTPLPTSVTQMPSHSYVSSAPRTSSRPHSPCATPRSTSGSGGGSPRMSRETRRLIQHFPPPPPPKVPPPAIPDDSLSKGHPAPGPLRPRASTSPSAVSRPLMSAWDSMPPSPTYSSAYDSVRGKRSGLPSSPSARSLVSAPIMLPSSLPPQSSPARESYHSHQRDQSNVLSTGAIETSVDQPSQDTKSLPQLPTAASKSTSASRGNTRSTRPALRQHKSQGTLTGNYRSQSEKRGANKKHQPQKEATTTALEDTKHTDTVHSQS